jgi:RNA polymerase sigma-70 factor (ECF subfamily)
MTALTATVAEDIFKAHERFLWGLLYRLTGNAADADDLVQETFIRAMKSPPARLNEPWRPWLVRVAINLGRDLLRQRRRRGYEGPWLPSPIETPDESSPPSYEPIADEEGNPAARYDLVESVSFAFLLALEALTPAQRAVLLLRDVFDYSVKETADALGMSEANVKTTHHRARAAMRDYDRAPSRPTKEKQKKSRAALEQFLTCLAKHDVAGAEALLAADVRQLSDGGGEFFAARVPIVGRQKVLTFYQKIIERAPDYDVSYEWRTMNGSPALIAKLARREAGYAPRTVTSCELDEDGRIKQLHVILASRKLTAVR